MASTTELVEVSDEEYTNVSSGNLNCYVAVQFGKKFRAVISGTQPEPDVEVYFIIHPPSDKYFDGWDIRFGVENLAAEDEIWVMAEENPESIVVVRGGINIIGGFNAA